MRLLNVNSFELVEREEPPDWQSSDYAILSHTWTKEEILFDDIQGHRLESLQQKQVYAKIQCTSEQAARDGLKYFWVDTCVIDNKSSADLQEAINSMYRWYSLARVCYVYLADVSAGEGWEDQFIKSRWWTRAWTLQELIAPLDVRFYDSRWRLLGQLKDYARLVSSITSIDVNVLRH